MAAAALTPSAHQYRVVGGLESPFTGRLASASPAIGRVCGPAFAAKL